MTAGTSLRALAYHAAAHAVANLALGLRVKTVTITPGDGSEGVCTGPSIWDLLDGNDPEGSRRALGDLMLATLAERRLTGQADTDPGCGDSECVG
jgi:hypothetical protein